MTHAARAVRRIVARILMGCGGLLLVERSWKWVKLTIGVCAKYSVWSAEYGVLTVDNEWLSVDADIVVLCVACR